LSNEVKLTPRSYLPLTSTIILAWFLTLLSKLARMSYPKPIITPVEEPAPTTPPTQALTNPAPYLNTIIIIGLITASGVVILYIARKKPTLFRILIGVLLWLISFSITTIYLINASFTIHPLFLRFWIPVSALAASIVTYLIFSDNEISSAIAASYIASGAGGTIGMSIPYWTFLVLTVGISAYDVFAVYKGHLSSLTKGEAASLKGLTVEIGSIVIGLGDLFFYSLTISAILWNFGEIPAAAATLAIIAGYTLTLTLLQRKKIVPGLPIPLISAIISAFLANMLI